MTRRPSSRSLSLAALALTAGVLAPRLARADETCGRAYRAAQEQQKESKLLAARRELLTCSQDQCAAWIRKDCVGWLAEVEASMPAVSIQVRGERGCDQAGATVWVDGVSVPGAAEGRPLDLDPGPHTIRAEIDGAMVEQTVVASVGDRRRVVTLAPPNALATCGAPEARPTPLAPPPVIDAHPVVADRKPIPTLVYVLGGAGLVGLGVGVGFGVSGFSQKGTLDDCKGACAQGDVDAMQRTFLVSDVALGTGVVALAAAVVVYFASR